MPLRSLDSCEYIHIVRVAVIQIHPGAAATFLGHEVCSFEFLETTSPKIIISVSQRDTVGYP